MVGACRCQELVTLLTTCVEDFKTHFLIKLKDTKTKVDRTFIIVPGKLKHVNLLKIVLEYTSPARTPHKRFFVNYIKGKCTVQPVGIHKIRKLSTVVAKYLDLDASLYTGNCFRRTSASLLVNARAKWKE